MDKFEFNLQGMHGDIRMLITEAKIGNFSLAGVSDSGIHGSATEASTSNGLHGTNSLPDSVLLRGAEAPSGSGVFLGTQNYSKKNKTLTTDEKLAIRARARAASEAQTPQHTPGKKSSSNGNGASQRKV